MQNNPWYGALTDFNTQKTVTDVQALTGSPLIPDYISQLSSNVLKKIRLAKQTSFVEHVDKIAVDKLATWPKF